MSATKHQCGAGSSTSRPRGRDSGTARGAGGRRKANTVARETIHHQIPKGEQVRIPTPGTNRKRSVSGALNLETGQWHYQVFAHKRAIEFLAFLDQVALASPGRSLHLVLDNASTHKAKVVQTCLADHPQVHPLSLLAYSGHAQNPVEKVWWRLKDRIAANRLHGSIDALVEAVHDFFGSFTPEDARRPEMSE